MKFEKCELSGSHKIISDNILISKENGRVVAVFYNDYDLDHVINEIEQLKKENELFAELAQQVINIKNPKDVVHTRKKAMLILSNKE